jgi:hypothetical protein
MTKLPDLTVPISCYNPFKLHRVLAKILVESVLSSTLTGWCGKATQPLYSASREERSRKDELFALSAVI